MIEILLALIAGILTGIVTGLVPGVHINLVSVLLVSFSPIILKHISPVALGAYIIGMAINHTFLDAIPGIYLGAPDEAQALSVLPGHRMLLKGDGYNAVKLTAIGSFFSLVLCILLVPVLIIIVRKLYPVIGGYIGWILIAIMSYMILKDKKRFWNFIIFMMAGAFGLIALNIPNIDNVLLPLLSGLFGFSILLKSLMENTKIPEQDLNKKLEMKASECSIAVVGATTAGFFASFLPGFGSSQAAIIAMQFMKNITDNGFLILVGGINTVNMALSLVSLYVIEKGRSGAMVALSEIVGEINIRLLVLYLVCALVAGCIALFLCLKISKIFSTLISKVNYKILVISVMAFVTLLVLLLSGFYGLIILFVGTCIGLVAGEVGVGRNHCCGCLILPVILYFII